MGLQQRFGPRDIAPKDPDFHKAPPRVRRSLYDYAGKMILEQGKKQLSKGVGANGRAMKPRLRPVLPDGADGPVMEPHYDASRVITLRDYTATPNGVTTFWQAGTGHRTHRKARAVGKTPTPFGTILEFHANGEVPHAPVRDVRLSRANTNVVQRLVEAEWARRKKRAARRR